VNYSDTNVVLFTPCCFILIKHKFNIITPHIGYRACSRYLDLTLGCLSCTCWRRIRQWRNIQFWPTKRSHL